MSTCYKISTQLSDIVFEELVAPTQRFPNIVFFVCYFSGFMLTDSRPLRETKLCSECTCQKMWSFVPSVVQSTPVCCAIRLPVAVQSNPRCGATHSPASCNPLPFAVQNHPTTPVCCAKFITKSIKITEKKSEKQIHQSNQNQTKLIEINHNLAKSKKKS